MIFNFLKYIHPIWYYNLRPKHDYSYFPTKEVLNKVGFYIEEDYEYKSKEARERDIAWRAFQQGFISPTVESGIDVWSKTKLPIEDEYRFFRKNFHKLWMLYVLAFRLITLHNPFKEIHAFWKTKNVNRQSHVKNHFCYPEFEYFQSDIIKKQ